jgi:hypothetical protein
MSVSLASRYLFRTFGASRSLSCISRVSYRCITTSSVKCVDKNRLDEFTKRKSEYRIPAMTDDRVRERHLLDIPMVIYLGLSLWMMFVFLMINKY